LVIGLIRSFKTKERIEIYGNQPQALAWGFLFNNQLFINLNLIKANEKQNWLESCNVLLIYINHE
jgi:hypothetical protein